VAITEVMPIILLLSESDVASSLDGDGVLVVEQAVPSGKTIARSRDHSLVAPELIIG